MAKADLKTKRNKASVSGFLNAVENDKRRKDGKVVLKMMKEITGSNPKMWGPSIIGFGTYHYTYESGREGDAPKIGFSPRKSAITIYIMPGFPRFEELMNTLGKFKTGKACLYINKLEDIDQDVLKKLVKQSWDYMTKKYG